MTVKIGIGDLNMKSCAFQQKKSLSRQDNKVASETYGTNQNRLTTQQWG